MKIDTRDMYAGNRGTSREIVKSISFFPEIDYYILHICNDRVNCRYYFLATTINILTVDAVKMTEDFDLESLVHLEQTYIKSCSGVQMIIFRPCHFRFYNVGHEDGFAHGRIHGLIEGRTLGREKGFEMWEELGFYKGFALMWQAVYTKQVHSDECAIASPRYLTVTEIGPRRASHHIKRLLDLIEQFPTVNPSASDSDLDIPKLFHQIRSRYKALCSTLGVKPSLRAAENSPFRDQE